MLHKGLNAEKWKEYSFAFQMGNIGAEVARFLNMLNKNDRAGAEKALDRVLELVQLTIDAVGSNNELKRLEEVLRAKLDEPELYRVSDSELNNYFLPFARVARK